MILTSVVIESSMTVYEVASGDLKRLSSASSSARVALRAPLELRGGMSNFDRVLLDYYFGQSPSSENDWTYVQLFCGIEMGKNVIPFLVFIPFYLEQPLRGRPLHPLLHQ